MEPAETEASYPISGVPSATPCRSVTRAPPCVLLHKFRCRDDQARFNHSWRLFGGQTDWGAAGIRILGIAVDNVARRVKP